MNAVDRGRRSLLQAMASGVCLPLLFPARAWATGAGRWIEAPVLPDVKMANHLGRSLPLHEVFHARPAVVVSFFYTGCGTVCPPQTALMRELREQLDRQTVGRRVLLVSISVDPLGDGPEQVNAYVQRFAIDAGREHGWVWLTGQPADSGSVLRAFGVQPGNAADHPNLVWMGDITRDRWVRSVALQSPDQLARQLQELMS